MSFGLNYGIPEFRFDVGSGAAVIRGYAPLSLDTWHTVRLIRSKKDGNIDSSLFTKLLKKTNILSHMLYTGVMEIDRQDNITGHSPGTFETLDLQLPLYIGGFPSWASAYNQSGFSSGFDGE